MRYILFLMFVLSCRLQAFDMYVRGEICTMQDYSNYLSQSISNETSCLSDFGWKNITNKQNSSSTSSCLYGLGTRIPINKKMKIGIGYEYIDLGSIYWEVKGYYGNQWIKESESDNAQLYLPYISLQYSIHKYWCIDIEMGYAYSVINSSYTFQRYWNPDLETENINSKFSGDNVWQSIAISSQLPISDFANFNLMIGFRKIYIPKYTCSSVSTSNCSTSLSVGDTLQGSCLDSPSFLYKVGITFSFDFVKPVERELAPPPLYPEME